jgi:cellulose synthase/poly-beta-1,6-N-acetylglucosamine synthase-like glycosyltransferase
VLFRSRQQGYKIGYLPEAVVRIRCPTNLSDLLKQRKRIWIGHMQLKQATGFDVSTSSFKNILYALPDLSVSEVFFAFLGGILEVIAYSQARLARNKKVPYMWEPIKSTKISITKQDNC